jgi:hypothetical protein
VLIAVAALLVFAPSAFAGGWATVGLDSTPAGVTPGDPWVVNITVLQHGRTPLDNVKPTLTIRSGDTTRTFDARKTDKVGVYAATVTFPTAGRWTYVVDDGFISGSPHTFPAVRIGAPASAPTATAHGGPNVTWLALGGVAFLLAALILIARRGRGREPQAA